MQVEFIDTMLRSTEGLTVMGYRFDIGWFHPPPAGPWRRLQRKTGDIESYRNRRMVSGGPDKFKKALVLDFEARRYRNRRGMRQDTSLVYATFLG